MSRVDADSLRINLGEYVGWLRDKYKMSYKDAQAINDIAHKIVAAMDEDNGLEEQ